MSQGDGALETVTVGPTLGRRGLDWLLLTHPYAEVARLVNQHENVVRALGRCAPESFSPWPTVANEGPWTCVDLIELDGTVGRYAIFNRTGGVYRLDALGAVEDDPIWKPD